MRDEYNISELNPRKNPYTNRLKKQITINIDGGTIDYFKSLADAKGIPYQTLINLYLRDCADNHRQLQHMTVVNGLQSVHKKHSFLVCQCGILIL